MGNVDNARRKLPPCLDDDAPRPQKPVDKPVKDGTRNGEEKEKHRCGPDVTDWFVEEMNLHLKFFSGYSAGFIVKIATFDRYAKRIAYKYLRFKVDNCPSTSCADTVTLCDRCIQVSELGNIMFGFVGQHWLRRPKFVIAGGIAAGKKSATGGIDSIPDMAGTFAGLQLAHFLETEKKTSLTRKELCAAITLTDKDLLAQIREQFDKDAKKLFDGIGNDPLAAMGKEDGPDKCPICTTALAKDAPHSDFDWVKTTADVSKSEKEWWKVYEKMTSGGIDNSKIPKDK